MDILELRLEANHIHEIKQFYSEILQLEIVKEKIDEITFRIGTSKLTFVNSKQHATYHFAINIPSNQIEQALEWLAARVDVQSDEGQQVIHFESWNAHSVYFLDPQGNIVELIARHDLPNQSTRPFSSKDFLCISEIGIASDNVIRDAELVLQALHLGFWRTPDPTFTTIGDQHGLIIMVNRGRRWYMSDLIADHYPTEVIIAGTDNVVHMITPEIRIICEKDSN